MRLFQYTTLRRIRRPALPLVIFVLFLVALLLRVPLGSAQPSVDQLERQFPLTWKLIHSSHGKGGAWVLPTEWLDGEETPPNNIVDAARLASKAALSDVRRQMNLSTIPLIVHQTWKTTQVNTWHASITTYVERWLEYSTSSQLGPMAYFFWDDQGVQDFFEHFEKDSLNPMLEYFSPVERTDIFRVLVCYWLGGIYGDIDTEPLRHPATWIMESDIAPWTDEVEGITYGFPPSSESLPEGKPMQPVHLLLGLEADTDPDSDSYWRMGYMYPVQLTQWALASAPQHPALLRFLEDIKSTVERAREKMEANSKMGKGPTEIDSAIQNCLAKVDAVILTGPVAITLAAMGWLQDEIGFRWNSLTGLNDSGRSKLVSDVLVLPVTGFSPGRGSYGNMGSKPITDPDARLYHYYQGSWRHFDLSVEYGKFCRTVFGLCRDWYNRPP